MDSHSLFILLVILLAYAFDFINGFHDAANSIATIVATGVLTPNQAVIWAAFFNFIAFLVFSLMVAQTIGKGLIDVNVVTPELIFSALVGAIIWNLFTWYFGIPSSSSHALIGGLAGAALIKGGFAVLIPAGFIKVALGIFISPLLGITTGLTFSYIFSQLLRRYTEEQLSKVFKGFQLASSALLSLTHGGNDAQKTMGIIAVLLFSASWLDGQFYIPNWVVLSCYSMISLGTLAGGWRIVHTMGHKITHLNTLKGCAAECGAATVIFAATEVGVPVSTTHTVTGSIAGVGLVAGLGAIQWQVFKRIFISWLLTIPAAGMVAGLIMLGTQS